MIKSCFVKSFFGFFIFNQQEGKYSRTISRRERRDLEGAKGEVVLVMDGNDDGKLAQFDHGDGLSVILFMDLQDVGS